MSGGFNPDDYVPVAERLVAFYDKYPEGSVQSDIIELSDKRVVMRATVYRNAQDERPSIAHSALAIPGKTGFTRDSEIENAETSAVGRAIAMMGFEVKRGVASREEVQNKRDDGPAKTLGSPPDVHDPGGIVGIVEPAKDSPDFEPHPTPDGYAVTFKLRGDRGGIKVVASSPIAEALTDEVGRDAFIGSRVSCWGRIKDESYTTKAGRKVTYQVLDLERITGSFGEFTMTRPAVAPGQVPAFDLEESIRLDAAEAQT